MIEIVVDVKSVPEHSEATGLAKERVLDLAAEHKHGIPP